jgi:hypothetical protein
MTIVLVPGGERSGAVRDLVGDWAGRDLVKDSIWIEHDTDVMRGALVTADGVKEVLVREELALRTIRTLRVVWLVLHGDPGDAEAIPSGTDMAGIQENLRLLAAEAGIGFVSGVVAATVPGSPLPERCFFEGWEFNLVVAPEDRIADDRMGVEVTSDSIVPVAASTLVSIAGMWRWCDDAPIDVLRAQEGSARPRIRLVRNFVRIVDGDHVVKKIADAVLSLDRSTGSWPIPIGGSPPCAVADDPVGIVSEVADQFIREFRLQYVPLESPLPQPPKPLNWWEGIKLFARRAWRIVLNLPVQWVKQEQERVNDALLKFFTEHTFGNDSDIVLTLRGHSLVRESDGAAGETTGTDKLRKISKLDMPGANVAVPEPALWSAFAGIGCGLADGSDFPEGVAAPMHGTARTVVPVPDLIAPPVGEGTEFRHQLLDGVVIESVDAFAANELERCVVSAIKIKGMAKAARPGSADDDQEAAESTGDVDKAADGKAQDGAVDGSVGSASDDVHAAESDVHLFKLADLEGLDREQLQTILDSFTSWKADSWRSASFAWRIGAAMGDGVVAASEELAAALTRIHQGPPADEKSQEEIEIAKKFRRFLRIGIVATLLALGLIFGLLSGGVVTLLGAAIVTVFCLLGSFSVLLRKFVTSTTAQVRAEFRRRERIGEYWFAFNRAYSAAAGIARFCTLYWQYLDWASTISVLVREPWGKSPEAAHLNSLVDMPRPLSLSVGAADVSPDQFQRSVASGRQSVITRGWLRSAFQRHVESSQSRYADLMRVVDGAATDARRDISARDSIAGSHAATEEVIYGPRSQVCHDATGRRFSEQARLDEARMIVDEALSHPLDELFSSVEVPPPAGRGLSGDTVTGFLSQIVPGAGRVPASFPGKSFQIPELHAPKEIQVVVPAGMQSVASDAVTSLRESRLPRRYGERFVMGVHRVDFSESCGAEELTLVVPSQSRGVDGVSAELPGGGPVDSGETPLIL